MCQHNLSQVKYLYSVGSVALSSTPQVYDAPPGLRTFSCLTFMLYHVEESFRCAEEDLCLGHSPSQWLSLHLYSEQTATLSDMSPLGPSL